MSPCCNPYSNAIVATAGRTLLGEVFLSSDAAIGGSKRGVLRQLTAMFEARKEFGILT
jgi:hypothetical protein